MSISYYGIPLLLDDHDRTAQQFQDRFLDLNDASIFGATPTAPPASRMQSQSANGDGVGIPTLNYSTYQPPQRKLNTLWMPTGAARWGSFLGLCDDSMLAKIKAAATGQPTTPGYLELGDSVRTLRVPMFMLPPRLISEQTAGENRLWLLPLVDVRYYWQFLYTTSTWDVELWTWSELFNHIMENLQAVYLPDFSKDDIPTEYLYPDQGELNRFNFPLNYYLDGCAQSVGMRVVFDPLGPTVKVQSVDSAGTILETNLANVAPTQTRVAGGDFSTDFPMACVPESVRVIFPKSADGAWSSPLEVHEETIETSDIASGTTLAVGAKRSIRSTSYADYTGGSIQNGTTIEALATSIATDLIGWTEKRYDRTFAGLIPWALSGFDDWIEWQVGRRHPDGSLACQTRVCSHPYNFGADDQCSQGVVGVSAPGGGSTIDPPAEDDCSPFNCVNGIALSSCTECAEGPETWVVSFGGGECDCGSEMFQTFSLTFRTPGAPIAAGVCVWESEEFACGSDTYIWVLAVTGVPNLFLIDAASWPTATLWDDALLIYTNRSDTYPWCCKCDNLLEMFCQPYDPPFCTSGPRQVCVKPLSPLIDSACLVDCCPSGIPEYISVEITGLTDALFGCDQWNGTYVLRWYEDSCRWWGGGFINGYILIGVWNSQANSGDPSQVCPDTLYLYLGGEIFYYDLSGTFDCSGPNTWTYRASNVASLSCSGVPATLTTNSV